MDVLLIAFDNGHFIPIFPQSLAALSAVLERDGHNVTIYNQDINHYSDEHLTEVLDNGDYGMVGLGIVAGYYPYQKLQSISKAVNASKKRKNFIYVLGGHGPSPEPEFYLKKSGADYVARGEGENTILELLNPLLPKVAVKGISLNYSDGFMHNLDRPRIENIDELPMPAYHLFPVETYRLLRIPRCESSDFVMPMLSGRGCRFTCNFCLRLDKGLRIRSNEKIVEEMEHLKSNYKINYFMFTDELLMCSEERTISLCKDFIKNKINSKWYCNGRLNYAKKDVLNLMKEAGCVFINYGIESFNDDILKVMKKSLTTKIIERGVQNTLDVGISPGLAVMFGNIGETAEHLQNSVNFLLKYDDHAQLRTINPLSPFPGSPIYYYAIEKGLLDGVEDFYENKCKNSDLMSVNFTNMTDEEFHKCLHNANKQLIENYYNVAKEKTLDTAAKLYAGDTSFRGFRRY